MWVCCRYKCQECDDFDYCENCFRTIKSHKHTFMRFVDPCKSVWQFSSNVFLFMDARTNCASSVMRYKYMYMYMHMDNVVLYKWHESKCSV